MKRDMRTMVWLLVFIQYFRYYIKILLWWIKWRSEVPTGNTSKVLLRKVVSHFCFSKQFSYTLICAWLTSVFVNDTFVSCNVATNLKNRTGSPVVSGSIQWREHRSWCTHLYSVSRQPATFRYPLLAGFYSISIEIDVKDIVQKDAIVVRNA